MRTEILVTGGYGMLGRTLQKFAPQAIFLSRRDCDLRNVGEVDRLFEKLKPERVLHLAARVGGVKTNAERNADLLAENVQINVNVLATAHKHRVGHLISLLSSCAFPPRQDLPATEDDVHAGLPFAGNMGYGYAKRLLDIQTRLLHEQHGCRFTTLTPVTMYGPHDNWDLGDGHVLSALVHKCFLAKRDGTPLEVWGSGRPVRQFIFVEDVARFLLQALDRTDDPETVILAPDDGITIRELAQEIAQVMGFQGSLVFNTEKPEGQLIKVLKSKRFPKLYPDFSFTPLPEGLRDTAAWFEAHHHEFMLEAS